MRFSCTLAVFALTTLGLVDAQDRIEREKQRFVLNHIRSVEGESRITSDYLQDIRAQKEKAKHTLIVFIKERGDSLTSLFRKLESLISTKIMKRECEERPPQNICRNGLFASYFKCYVKMAEMKINSVLVEFTSVNGGNPACHFSKNGEIHLGISRRTTKNNQNWFIIDHLFKSKLYEGKPCITK